MMSGKCDLLGQITTLADQIGAAARFAQSLAQASAEGALRMAADDRTDLAYFLLAVRRQRDEIFGAELVDDCGWEMLVELVKSEAEGAAVAVTSLCAATSKPQTSALRKLDSLVQAGYIIRMPDPRDRRRVIVELSPRARGLLDQLCQKVTRQWPKSRKKASASPLTVASPKYSGSEAPLDVRGHTDRVAPLPPEGWTVIHADGCPIVAGDAKG